MKKQSNFETEISTGFMLSQNPLTAEEEINLSKRILAGTAVEKELENPAHLTEDQYAALAETVRDGKQAYELLVTANIPRAKKFAAQTFRNNPFGLNDYADYEQTALRVICEAAKTYNWQHGCRFGTWAHMQLKQAMIRENALNAYAIRIPEENIGMINQLRNLSQSYGCSSAAKALGLKQENADRLMLAANVSKSLQDPVNAEEPDAELGEIIADGSAVMAEEIEENIDRNESIQKLYRAMELLPEKQRELVKMRMGFNGTTIPMRELTGMYGKTTSSVQKQQEAALRQLREIFNTLLLVD